MRNDVISEATAKILLPSLEASGFSRLTNRITARVVEDILQVVLVHVSARGTRWFRMEYASLCLFRPRDTLPLQPGGRLVRYTESKKFWQRMLRLKAQQHGFPGTVAEEANASMAEAAELTQVQAMPFFKKTGSVAGLCKHLEKERWGAEHHLHFETGCCLARLRRYTEAKTHLKRAVKLYEKDGLDWCETEATRASSLIAAIDTGEAEAVLNQWTEYSVAELNLRQVVGNQLAKIT